jgi:iron-sulfur cluster assembly protein
MFAITEDAAEAINSIVLAPGTPEGAGMRITCKANEADGGERTDVHLSVVEAPQEGDEVLERERLFVDPDAAEYLDDKVLDADFVDDDVRFSLEVQPEGR